MSDRAGYDSMTWRLVRPFAERVAVPDDVENGPAVFALGDTVNARMIDTPRPQPVVWYAEDEDVAALLVQAETHETETGEELQVAGLLLPSGDTAVALMEDIEPVEDGDVVWLALLEAQLEDDGEGDWPADDEEEEDDDPSA